MKQRLKCNLHHDSKATRAVTTLQSPSRLWSCCVIEVTDVVQVYKAHLVETRGSSAPALDSARANLANTFVNAFVNAGFGQVSRYLA